MDESFSIKAEKRKTEFEADLCIIYLTKKPKENMIKEPKFCQVLSRTYFQFYRKDIDIAMLQQQNLSLEQKGSHEQILRTRKKSITDSQNLLPWFYNWREKREQKTNTKMQPD